MKAQTINRKLSLTMSFLLFMIILSRPAQALYDVNNTGVSDVYGLSGNDVQPAIGSEFGTVRVIAVTDNAYALFGDGGDIEISGDFGDSGTIYAEAGNSYAWGLYTNNNSITTGSINGTISSKAGNFYAYGLHADEGSITTGDINGTIIAEAGDDYAYGLESYFGSIITGDINGTIYVKAEYTNAICMSSNVGSIYTGDINGIITAEGGTDGVLCLIGRRIIIGDINGTISATAGRNDAYGLYSSSSVLNTGDINGTITVTAGNERAFGLYSDLSSIFIDDISGIVTATAENDYAYGLYTYSGSITTGAIRGTISAHTGGDYAYAVIAYSPLNIKVDGGTISAIADTGLNVAAIQSGKIYINSLQSKNANDRVEIVAGSTIIGDIDLAMYGTDNDILTLSGYDSNSTTLNDDLKNIETINLTGGTWYINGDVYNSLNGINMTGGVLGGTGTLGSLNVTDGTLAPGNSIGTTTINGDLTLGSDSTLEVEIDNSGNSDKLVVSGDASINGGTLKAISTETITDSQEYTIIEAQSISGKFDTLDTALLSTTISNPFTVTENTSNTLLLKIFPMQFDSSEIVTTKKQASIGSALQVIADSGGNSITTGLQQLTNLSDVRNAYDQLSGQTIASLASVTSTGSTQFTGTVSGRLHNAHSGLSFGFNDSPLFAMAQPDRDTSMYDTGSSINSFALGNGTNYFSNKKWGFWLRGYGVFGDRETQSESPGYQYRIYGTGFGVDYKFTDEMLLGITGGYSDGKVDYFSSRDESEITSTPLGIYGSWFTESGYVDSLINYTPMEYETTRYVDLTSEKLKGEFDGSETSAYLEAGRNWFLGKDLLVQPMTSFQYSYLSLDSYTESGGVSALGFDEHCYQSYKGSLGMKAKKQFLNDTKDKNLTFELRGRWIHEFGDTKSNINANFAGNPSAIFKISDKGLPRDSAILGIGLKQIEKQNMMYYADYDISLNREDTSHIISAGLKYLW